ncbi:MAG: hypothetical protein LBP53_07810 [Candidatus Peribacteria bacterium]|nr:hypothetical protein [Candidatus Peribacteria bacterium]
MIIPNKTLSYEYDEITNSFFITIPELCVTLRSTVLEQLQISKEDYLAKGDEIFVETNVSQIKAEKAKGIIISNNTISI